MCTPLHLRTQCSKVEVVLNFSRKEYVLFLIKFSGSYTCENQSHESSRETCLEESSLEWEGDEDEGREWEDENHQSALYICLKLSNHFEKLKIELPAR